MPGKQPHSAGWQALSGAHQGWQERHVPGTQNTHTANTPEPGGWEEELYFSNLGVADFRGNGANYVCPPLVSPGSCRHLEAPTWL